MTCIVGLIQGDDIWMGGDSAGVDVRRLEIRSRKDTKVFEVDGKFLIGYTSSFRMGQLMRFGFSPPSQEGKAADYEYMCTVFIDAIRKRLKDGGYAKVKDGREEGGQFLVGYRGRLYTIHEDFQVGETSDEFDAVGCGADYALGSLYSRKNPLDPKWSILEALKAAEYFSAGVRRPFVVRRLKWKKGKE